MNVFQHLMSVDPRKIKQTIEHKINMNVRLTGQPTDPEAIKKRLEEVKQRIEVCKACEFMETLSPAPELAPQDFCGKWTYRKRSRQCPTCLVEHVALVGICPAEKF